METKSAKYTRDLNGGGTSSDANFPQSESGAGGGGGLSGDMRSKIMSGMKKIMQSLMGLSEEESEQLLFQLARDPNSSGARAKIKVAIEKMMSSSDKDKALTREQLRSMMQGLSKGSWMEEMQRKDRTNGKKENFDQDAIRNGGKTMVFPRNRESRMLDEEDYNPLEGLDRKEYFDWVNPPGFETGAPGSPNGDGDGEEFEHPGYYGNHADDVDGDTDDENASDEEGYDVDDIEYYPSDEAQTDKTSEHIEAEIDEDGKDLHHEDENNDFCQPGIECKDTSNHHPKYAKDQNPNPSTTNAEKEQGNKDDFSNNHDDMEWNVHENEHESGNFIEHEEETEDNDDHNKEDNHGNSNIQDYYYSGNHDNTEMQGDENGDGTKEEDDVGDREEDREEDVVEEDECKWDGDSQKCHEEELEDLPFIQRKLTPNEMIVQKMLDEEVPEETKVWMDEMMKIDDNAYFLLNDLPELETVMTDDQLNGSNRVVADGLAAEQECGTLLRLLDGEAKTGDGYRGKTSPHTKFENFEGLTVKDAVDAAAAGRIPLLYPTVYMHLAERSRQYLQRHFQLESHLFFSFTHLVCRSAGPGILTAYSNLKRDDLSHPVHADNCQLDHKGVCHKRLPAFVWRDWSAILYLNQEFEGGEFIFAHFNNTAQAVVSPKCGRLVGFSAGSENLHGVKGVIHGRRCALAMWYTLDPRFRELEFFQAADHLNTLYEKEYRRQNH